MFNLQIFDAGVPRGSRKEPHEEKLPAEFAEHSTKSLSDVSASDKSVHMAKLFGISYIYMQERNRKNV